MANNTGIYCNKWISNQSYNDVEVKELLMLKQKHILNLFGYDISLLMLFDEFLNVAIVKEMCVTGQHFILTEVPQTIFINKIRHSPIKRLLDTKNIVYNHSKSFRLIREMESELYIPLFEPLCLNTQYPKLEGCLYLGATAYKEFSLESISNLQIREILTDISRLFLLELVELKEQGYLMGLICVFMDILGKKVSYLPSHSYNVASWAKEIGIALGYGKDKLRQLAFAGLLHDIGKSMVENDILNKSGSLTEEEYERIREHSNYGANIARNLFKDDPKFEKVPYIIKYHHERYDGKGYPDRLEKNEVPFESYIIGIADAVDAMLMERSYKESLTLDNIIKELYKNKGKQFHPQLVDIMVTILSRSRKYTEKDNLFGINIGSLILNFKDKLNIIEGILLNYDFYYVFKPISDDLSNMDLSDITHVEMAIKSQNSLNYYEVKLEDFQNNLFYISTLKLVPSVNCFSLLWMLKGILYLENNRELPINIVKVGGDSMLFYMCTSTLESLVQQGIPLKVRILFDECYVDVTGIIVKSYNFGIYKYFDFKYTNIPDSKRDAIFRELFKKQIELRKAIAKYS